MKNTARLFVVSVTALALGFGISFNLPVVAGDPNSTASIILREGGVNTVIEQDGGVVWGLSDSRLVWSNSTHATTHASPTNLTSTTIPTANMQHSNFEQTPPST